MSFSSYLGMFAIVAALISGWAIYCAQGKRFWQFVVGVVVVFIAFEFLTDYLEGLPLLPAWGLPASGFPSGYGFFTLGVWLIVPALLIVSIGNMVKSGSSSALRIFTLTFVLCWIGFALSLFLGLYGSCYLFNECI